MMSKLPGSLSIPLLCLALLMPRPGAAEGHHTASSYGLSAALGITRDDNVTRAELDRDVFDDSYLSLEATGRAALPLNAHSYLMLRATLGINEYLDFDGLSNNRLGVDASCYYKPVLRFTAPQLFARLRHEIRQYDSDHRDGDAQRITLGVMSQLSELVTLEAGYTDEEIDADQRTFDVENSKFYVDLSYRLDHRHSLYLTLSKIDGEVVATTVPTTPIINAASSIVRDDAFLDIAPARFAYRIDADTLSLQLGDAWQLDRYQGLDLSLLYYDTDALNNEYSGLILAVFYTYNFL